MRVEIVVTWLCIAVILFGIGWSQAHKKPRSTYHHGTSD